MPAGGIPLATTAWTGFYDSANRESIIVFEASSSFVTDFEWTRAERLKFESRLRGSSSWLLRAPTPGVR